MMFTSFTFLLARRHILIKWKHVSPSTHNRWIKDVLHYIKIEKIRFSLKGSLRSFEKTWTPFLDFGKTVIIAPEDGDN